jgi:hypothetical protein
VSKSTLFISIESPESDTNLKIIAVNMNYTCVIVGGLLFLCTGWWFVVRKPYTERMLKARDENEALVAAGVSG